MSRERVVSRASWTALHRPGTDRASLAAIEGGWRLSGRAELRFPEGDSIFRYVITCNERWEPRSADLAFRLGSERRKVEIEAGEDLEWMVAGFRNPDLQGCTDLDFAASPSTNTLALNRLALPVGGRAEIRTVYIMFPDIVPIAVRQRYTRLAERRYFYEGLHNGFEREFEVDDRGWVSHYPGGWEWTESRSPHARPRTRSRSR